MKRGTGGSNPLPSSGESRCELGIDSNDEPGALHASSRDAPTGKRVEVALVVIVHFRDGKLAHEHIYWDQASVLLRLSRARSQ